MSALVVTLLRFGFLALLWLFVFIVVAAVRKDASTSQLRTRVSSKKRRARARTPQSRPAAPQQAALPREWMLTVTHGPLAGTQLPLSENPILIGRSPECTLVLDDNYASGRHARFYCSAGQPIIEDLGSTNGTWVGNAQIHEPTALQPGIAVTIGKTTMEVQG